MGMLECPECYSDWIADLHDGSYLCRTCGKDWNPDTPVESQSEVTSMKEKLRRIEEVCRVCFDETESRPLASDILQIIKG